MLDSGACGHVAKSQMGRLTSGCQRHQSAMTTRPRLRCGGISVIRARVPIVRLWDSAPFEFEPVINLRVQKRSGSVPSTLRAHAEEVIDWSGALCCSMALRTTVARQLCKRGVDVDARKDSMDAVRAYVEYGRNLNP